MYAKGLKNWRPKESHGISNFVSVSSPSGCSGEIDLVFAIDASGSIRVERFPYVLDFAISIAEELEIRNGKKYVKN